MLHQIELQCERRVVPLLYHVERVMPSVDSTLFPLETRK